MRTTLRLPNQALHLAQLAGWLSFQELTAAKALPLSGILTVSS
ncbi:hypothetical protein BH10PLA2_BH10PLA2_14080 [soil metagenome]